VAAGGDCGLGTRVSLPARNLDAGDSLAPRPSSLRPVAGHHRRRQDAGRVRRHPRISGRDLRQTVRLARGARTSGCAHLTSCSHAEGSLMPLLFMKLVFTRMPETSGRGDAAVARMISAGPPTKRCSAADLQPFRLPRKRVASRGWFAGRRLSRRPGLQHELPIEAAQPAQGSERGCRD